MAADRAESVACIERALAGCAALTPWRTGTARGTLWIAFSGGRDSTVLLHALCRIAPITAIHIDHALHPQSRDWARRCAATAACLGIDCATRQVQVARDGNLEHAARQARYRAWRELLGTGDAIALAHHADDQAETRLWQLLTGRAPLGMPTERRLGHGHLLRPLLGVPRQTLADYAAHCGLDWIEDPSNADLALDRNYIRHRLLPPLAARFPAALERLRQPRPSNAAPPPPLAAQAATPQRIKAWLRAADLPTPAAAIAEIARQSTAAADRNPCIRIAPGLSARRHRGTWHLAADTDADATAPTVQRIAAGEPLETGHGTLLWERSTRGLPEGMELLRRSRQGGERIRPDGRNGTKTIKALFQEAGVPPWQRRHWPLLYAARAPERLVAVPGLATDAASCIADGYLPTWHPKTQEHRERS